MKNPARIFFCLVISVWFISCDEKPRSKDKPITLEVDDLSKYDPITFSRIDSVFVIDSAGAISLGQNLIIQQDSGDVFVMDGDAENAIYRLDRDGNLVNAVFLKDQILNGGGLHDFRVTNGTIEVLASEADQGHFIHHYDRFGRLKPGKKPAYYGQSFARLADGRYFFYSSYNPYQKWRLTEVVNDSIANHYLPNIHKGEKRTVQELNFFSPDGQSLLFFEAFNPGIMRITSRGIETEYVMDAGEYTIPPDFWDEHIHQGFEKISENGFFIIYRIFENSTKLLIVLRFNQAEEAKTIQLFVDKTTNEIKVLETDFGDQDLFACPVLINESHMAYAVSRLSLKKALKSNAITLREGIHLPSDSWQTRGNPIIAWVALK